MLPFMTDGPLIQSSPGLRGGKLWPVSGSTILAWQLETRRPFAPFTALSSTPTGRVTPAVVSVSPYACNHINTTYTP